MQTVETYRSRKRRAEELFDTVTNNVRPLVEEQQRYEEATSSFEFEEFETAAEQMKATVTNLETTLNHIDTYQRQKSEFENHDEEATTDGIILSEAKDNYEDAVNNFEAGDYATAAEQMSQAAEKALKTITTARQAREIITTAEEFSPIQPFVKAVAKQLGSERHLTAANTAATAGEYNRAKAEASQARSAQRSARAVISGGIGASAVSLYGIHRYDGLDKMADYLIDSTT
jgi:HEPN domain-containing protein